MVKLSIPQFWYSNDSHHKTSYMPAVLWPFAQLYYAGHRLNRAIKPTKKSPLPVICVGNVTMGGAGKTPTARALLPLIKDHGQFHSPCFLMRGFGGKKKGPLLVNPREHTSWDVGDEALMQAQYAPTIIARDRYQGALLAEQNGYDLIIMDDGFQNPSLEKDLTLIIVDGGFGFGNQKLFPSGPLREPIQQACDRADAAIVINKQDGVNINPVTDHLPTFGGTIHLHETKPQKYLAFAGIARPEKFFQTLENNGHTLVSHHAFPDHHTYTHAELDSIVSLATQSKAIPITTEKDWIRLSKNWRNKISYLGMDIELSDKFKTYFFQKLSDMVKS